MALTAARCCRWSRAADELGPRVASAGGVDPVLRPAGRCSWWHRPAAVSAPGAACGERREEAQSQMKGSAYERTTGMLDYLAKR